MDVSGAVDHEDPLAGISVLIFILNHIHQVAIHYAIYDFVK